MKKRTKINIIAGDHIDSFVLQDLYTKEKVIKNNTTTSIELSWQLLTIPNPDIREIEIDGCQLQKFIKTGYYENNKFKIWIHPNIGYMISTLMDQINVGDLNDKLYKKYLNNQKYFTIIENPQYSSNNNWLNILKINGIYYDKIIGLVKYLKKFNIETRPIWYANHLQKPFLKCQAYKISKAIELQESCICLPSSHSLCEKDIKSISIKIINFFQKTL